MANDFYTFLEELPSFPPGSNPFNHDKYHMGTQIGKNLIIMHGNHTSENADYIILVFPETGKRFRLSLTEEGKTKKLPEVLLGTLVEP